MFKPYNITTPCPKTKTKQKKNQIPIFQKFIYKRNPKHCLEQQS